MTLHTGVRKNISHKLTVFDTRTVILIFLDIPESGLISDFLLISKYQYTFLFGVSEMTRALYVSKIRSTFDQR